MSSRKFTKLISLLINSYEYVPEFPSLFKNNLDLTNCSLVFLDIIFELSSKGNSIIIIEHNIDVLKVSDYIIELGPRGGKNGGRITFEGSLNDIIADKNSITGSFIKKEVNL